MSNKKLTAINSGSKNKPALKASGRSQVKRYTRSKAGNFFYVLFLILFGSFSVLPLIYCIVTAFKPLEELLVYPPKLYVVNPTLQNFMALPDLLSNLKIPLSRYIFNSFFVTVITTLLYVFIAAMAAFTLAKSKIRGRRVFFLVVQLALLFNGTTLSVPLYLIYSWLGIIDTYWVMILPYIASTMGVFLMKQYMESTLPLSLIEAARIDGSGEFRTFNAIVMPLMKPAIAVQMIFTFVSSWNNYFTPALILHDDKKKTLPILIAQLRAADWLKFDMGQVYVMIAFSIFPVIIVYLILSKHIVQGVALGSVKG